MHYIETPLLENLTLNNQLQKSVHFKMENLQPSGSFKLRGMDYMIQTKMSQGASKFVCSSGGNAGMAAAYSCNQRNASLLVAIPESTPSETEKKLNNYGCAVKRIGETWKETDKWARAQISDSTAYLSPFDDPLLWTGHATMITEAAQHMTKPDAIICAVGGGGLLLGVLEGMEQNGWSDVPVITNETTGTNCFSKSIQTGSKITLDKTTGIATSLAAPAVADELINRLDNYAFEPQVWSDEDTIQAAKAFAKTFNMLVEPACGAALSPIFANPSVINKYDNILVIVCGGINWGHIFDI